LSVLIDKAVRYADIEKTAFETERKLLREVNLFDVYEGKNLEAGKKSYAVSFTMQDPSKTMTDQQVDQIMGRIQAALGEKLGATLR
jgi:phenylalanyl-tRNA synthetase beta chain